MIVFVFSRQYRENVISAQINSIVLAIIVKSWNYFYVV